VIYGGGLQSATSISGNREVKGTFSAEVGGEGFKAWEFGWQFEEGAVIGKESVIGDSGKPSGGDLENMELLVLLKTIGKGITAEVNGEKVAAFKPKGKLCGMVVEEPCAGIFQEGKSVDGKVLAKRVPRLNEIGWGA